MQTILGLMALMISMLIALNVQRASVSAQVQVYKNEVETVAGGVALEVLDYVGSKPFDAATAAATVTSYDDLTPAPFGADLEGDRLYEAASDIDDFHAIEPYTFVSDFDLAFTVTVQVQYVEEGNPELASESPTFAKKVTVTVDNPNLKEPLTLSQVYTYPE